MFRTVQNHILNSRISGTGTGIYQIPGKKQPDSPDPGGDYPEPRGENKKQPPRYPGPVRVSQGNSLTLPWSLENKQAGIAEKQIGFRENPGRPAPGYLEIGFLARLRTLAKEQN